MTTSDARIERLEDTFGEIRDRLDRMDERFDRTNARIDHLYDQMSIGFDRVYARFDHVNERLGGIEDRAAKQYRWLAGIVITMSAGMIASTITIAVAVLSKL